MQLLGTELKTPRSIRFPIEFYDSNLQPINEEHSNDQIELQEACLDETITNSLVNSVYNMQGKSGLLGRPTDFTSGDLR